MAANTTLTNTSLAVTGLPTLTSERVPNRQLDRHYRRQHLHGQRLDWRIGSLIDSAATVDTVTASKSAGFTLANTSLSATDSMTSS